MTPEKFPRLHEHLKEGSRGRAKIEFFQPTEQELHLAGRYDPEYPCPTGTYTRLVVDGEIMMTDTSLERATNVEVFEAAHGRVLVAGLGLGLILLPILDKDEVESVTVVEMDSDVIALIAPQLNHPKLNLVQGDIFEWRPEPDEKFQTIYFDIWPVRRAENLEEMRRLHEAFRPYLHEDDDAAWMDSWYRRELEKEAERERLLEERTAAAGGDPRAAQRERDKLEAEEMLHGLGASGDFIDRMQRQIEERQARLLERAKKRRQEE